MTENTKPLGYIRNLANRGMVHLVYQGGLLSIGFPVGHVLEMIVDGDCPSRVFTEKELEALTGSQDQIDHKPSAGNTDLLSFSYALD